MLPGLPNNYQNGPQWQIELLRDDGTRLAWLYNAGPFAVTSAMNTWGSFELVLPQAFDKTLATRDRRVRFWRKPQGGVSAVEFEGIVRRVTTAQDANGQYVRVLRGPSLEYLLSGRVIAAYAGASGADKTAAIDDMMKAFVTEQMGSSASASRQLPASLFTVQGNATLGTSTTKAASYRNLLDVLRELSDASRQLDATKEVFFWMQPIPPGFEFRTALGQPGADRTTAATALVFSPRRGNLLNGALDENWMDEANHAYALGLGTGTGRTVTSASNAARVGGSLLALREVDIQHNYATGGAEAAASAVNAARPALTFTGELQSVGSTVYGRDWGKFDKVLIDFDDRQFPALVRSVTAQVDETGRETLSAYAEAYL